MNDLPKPDFSWDRLARMEESLAGGAPLVMSDELREFLRRIGLGVALGGEEVEALLQDEHGFRRLITEARRRIREGSRRLMRAIPLAAKLAAAGEVDRARAVFLEILQIEVVPLYIDTVKRQLAKLADS
jgi:DUSAM domain-containing protein